VSAEGANFIEEEAGLKFKVNLSDYLDTGLFLDHRLVRARLRELARGKCFLNLFAYTASASVHAAAGAVVGLINNASRPVYYDRPVVYSQPRVVYDTYYPAPVVTRRVVETRTVYEDPYQTRYIRSDDGYDD
jgi:hypothetical protein